MQHAEQREADIATLTSAGMDSVGALVCLPGHGLQDTLFRIRGEGVQGSGFRAQRRTCSVTALRV